LRIVRAAVLICWRRQNRGQQISEELRQRVVTLFLDRAWDDPDVQSPEFQKEFDAFAAALHGSGVECDQLAMALCAVNAGGWSLPEFLLYLGSLPPAVIVAAAGLCGAWVQGRYGRKVRLKIGDVEAEGRTPEEIQALLQQAADFQNAAHRKKDKST
jgi:hypothetical protein